MFFTILPEERRVLEIVGQSALEMGVPAYVVGGYVRDRLLGRPTKDIDIVCVGDGIRLAETVAGKLSPRPKVAVYSRFGTAMLRCEGIEYEFVGAQGKVTVPTAESQKLNWVRWKTIKIAVTLRSMRWQSASAQQILDIS